jgi:hypothetical protein
VDQDVAALAATVYLVVRIQELGLNHVVAPRARKLNDLRQQPVRKVSPLLRLVARMFVLLQELHHFVL